MKYKISLSLFFINQLFFSQTEFLNTSYEVIKTTYTYSVKHEDSLKLDFYEPQKTILNKPLLVYVHGGSFSGGKRDDEYVVKFANEIAKRGYAVASISYQLTMKKLGFSCLTKAKDKIKAFNTASKDISYAVKHILKNNSLFKIDPNKIIISGTSSGAESVLNLAYVYKNKILPKNFKFAGVISMAGAITTLNLINSSKAIPTQLFHGTNDNKVPYYIASHHYCSKKEDGYLMLYGSRAIADRLKGLGKPYYLFSINGGTHNWSGIPTHRCINEILDFLYYDVIQNNKRQTERTIGL